METVLIVDDLPANIKVLGSLLTGHYNLLVANNGEKAINIATEKIPDLILLDIMMPDLDGYTVCKMLKANDKTKEIPIIFITAKAEIDDLVKGFETGGVDYITKPFQPEEVMVRIKTHLTIQRQKLELSALNATKDKFFSIIAHDLKNPVISFRNIFSSYYELRNALSEEESSELIGSLKEASDNLYLLLEQLLSWARAQRGQIEFNPKMLNLKQITDNVLATQKGAAANKNINLIGDAATLDINLTADTDMITTIIRNLVSNAIKFTTEGGEVSVSCKATTEVIAEKKDTGEFWEISISDTGTGMTEEVKKKLFRIDCSHKNLGTKGEKGTGLGLILCKEFAEIHGGRIWAESEEGKGSTFKFTIPKEYFFS